VWGYGLYTLPKLKYLQYSPRTKSWLRTQHRFGEFKNSLKSFSFFRKLHQLWKPESIDSEGKKLKALEKIDFFSTNIKEDFDVFCRHYDHPLEFLSFHNAHIEQIVGHTKNARIHPDASYILIGNSNTPTCNYHDAIDLVETYGPKGMKAYIIASYGDNEAYRSEITRYAASQKLVEFEMITDFMPLKEYITLLQNCSVGVFHHYRQQAMNNIIAMLYMGARVYLCERNPVYKYLRRHQINVFSIEKDVPILGFTRLEESPALENRKILEDVFSYENMVKSIHNWFETVKRINDKQFL
jgi:dTDP-N-acetylfucosamine:lipid II N-acetylfucosaminyltransferase